MNSGLEFPRLSLTIRGAVQRFSTFLQKNIDEAGNHLEFPGYNNYI